MRYFIDSHDKILEIVNSNANIECYNFNNRILGKIFCNGDFKYIKHENYDKNYIRLLDGNKMGQCCVAGNILSISQIIERAIMSAKHNNDVTSISVCPRNTDDYPTPKIYDENIDRMNLSDIEQYILKTKSYIQKKAPGVECDIACESEVKNIKIVNSSGLAQGYKKTGIHMSVWLKKERNGQLFTIYDKASSLKIDDFHEFIGQILNELEWETLELKNIILDNSYSVILAPKILGQILVTLYSMNSYQFISQKVSPISKLIDKQIFANGLCITDSGCDDWAVNSSPFDDEGVATRTTQLFQNGYYKNSISDCETVEKYHVYPTGNARKKNGFTMPFNNNVSIILPNQNEISFGRMVKETKRGIYMAMANVDCNIRGEFALSSNNAYIIENGEVVAKVGDILKCSGNVFELLGYIDQLSTDKSIAKGNMYLPYALINNFSFK